MAPVKRRATYDDLLALPEHVVGEIIDGELIVSPRPALRHARVSTGLSIDIGAPFDRGRGGPGGWLILDEPELHFGATTKLIDVLVPDIAGWRRERLPEMPDAAYSTLAPDWICEVLSPSTARIDRARKLDIYRREGVAHAWLVDPLVQTLEVLRREDDGWKIVATHEGEATVRAEPFDAVELALAPLWSR